MSIGTAAILTHPSPQIASQAKNDSRDIAGDVLRRQSQLEAERANWDNYWQDVADLVTPRNSTFTAKRPEGDRRTEKIFDSTAPLASDRFAAAFESMLTPRTQLWHQLKPLDDDLADDTEVKRWCEDVNKRLFAFRYSPRSNFASQIHEVYKGLGDFGTGALFSEEIPGEGISYRAVHLGGLYIVEDFQGRIRHVHYKHELTAEQAAQRFGLDNLPDQIKSKLEQRPDDKSTYLHVACPNASPQYGSLGPKGMRFQSIWISVDARQVVGTGGFRTFPYAVSRYVTTPGEAYGRSPAMMALPDVKMLNVMAQTAIQEAQLSVAPPLLAPNDGILSAYGDGVSLLPAAINYGAVDDQGRPLIHPLNRGSQFAPVKEEIAERRQSVNAAFLVTLFQILVDTPQMTATEAMLRAQEKGALLAPTTGRQQSELLGPIVAREIDLLARAGALPRPPEQLLTRGGAYKIEYNSPLTRAMKADQGVGFLRTVEALSPLAQIDPSVMDVFNPDEIGVGLADINGVPAKWLRSKDEIDALRQGRAQAQQAQQLVAAAPAAASAVKDIAQASAAAGKGAPA
jgi:hypothetical protein